MTMRGSRSRRKKHDKGDTPPPPAGGPVLDSPANRSVLSDLTMSGEEEDIITPQTFYSAAAASPPLGGRQRSTESSSSLLMEYSETSDDPDLHHPSEGTKDLPTSAFRYRSDSMHKSGRVVQFTGKDNSTSDLDDEENQQQRHHRRNHHQVDNQKRFLGQQANHWMTQLAYSFRSPQTTHKRLSSNALKEYPHSISASHRQHHSDDYLYKKTGELQPLLSSSDSPSPQRKRKHERSKKDAYFVAIAAAFLQDYESNRPPSLPFDLASITEHQMSLHRIKYHSVFPILLVMATMALFISSGLEATSSAPTDGWILDHRPVILTGLNCFAIVVFASDLWIRHELRGRLSPHDSLRHDTLPDPRIRGSRSGRLVKPLLLFFVMLGVECISRLFITAGIDKNMVLFTSLFKPLVLFYVSHQARDALEALRRIIKITTRVIIMELLVILMFAAVACRLFSNYESFHDLSTSWLSLFELATTVVNPSIWMPMYHASKWSAAFFMFFVVTSVFYLHSLVLSVVFQTYIHAASEIHERTVADREHSVHLAYLGLKQQQELDQTTDPRKETDATVIDIELVRDLLQLLRPHYNALKISALLEIVDPSNQKVVDYPTFRTKIRQALNASIRTARNASTLAMSVELMAVVVAVVNFIYVIMVSSAFHAAWFDSIQEVVGAVITLVAGFELLVRFNPLHIADFTPLTRLNTTFDGLALVAALTSCIGIVLYVMGIDGGLEFILMGRAIDMIRVMRFFRIFRDVVRRSADVIPALMGPTILVVTTLHIFVYLGMALWGGAVDVGEHAGSIEDLYDLNNFNSYQEGVVTVFQVLVVNDWHAIAQVFLFADRCSSPFIVYPFFVIGNLIGVSIMLNVLTAFFVQSFVTKINDDSEEARTNASKKESTEKDYAIQTPESTSTSMRRASSSEFLAPAKEKGVSRNKSTGPGSGSDHESDADSEASSGSEFYEFDVYEREGFDKIMQTVAGGSTQNGDFARHICDYLEILETLTPGREPIGYMVCDQLTLERFGNHRFQTMAAGFLDVNTLHVIVSDMHAELLALASRANDRSLIRSFKHPIKDEVFEVSAALLRRHPALSLFVARLRKKL